jgi:hypothetical protein
LKRHVPLAGQRLRQYSVHLILTGKRRGSCVRDRDADAAYNRRADSSVDFPLPDSLWSRTS